MNPSGIVVIGGGVAGTSVAYQLAAMGCRNVVLVEKSVIGSGSTSKSDGIVERQFVDEFDILLRVKSFEILKFFFKNKSVGFTPIGYVRLSSDPRDIKRYAFSVKVQKSLGVKDAAVLDRDQVKALLPFMETRDICVALYCASDGVVNGSELAWAFANEASKLGVKILQNTEVQKISRRGSNKGFILKTNRGEFEYELVVNAAGPWAGKVAKMCGLDIPVKPLRRQIVEFRRPTQKSGDLPFIIDMKSRLYLHGSGEKRTVYAGIHKDFYDEESAADPDSYRQEVDFEFIERVSSALFARAPGLKHLELKGGWSGLYEATPDSRPILGGHPDLPSLVNCVGFSGYGIQLAPIAGKLVAEMIMMGDAVTVKNLSVLKIQRFKEKATYSLF
jgi:sarcosine oxidase subunit beta